MNAHRSEMEQLRARADVTPYKELDYYGEEDADRFAGRERDIAQVTARACTQRSLVVYGRSGLGKTSLLKAGVMPLLWQRGFLAIYVRTLEEPLQDLTTAVLAHCGAGTPPDASLATLVRTAGETSPVIIVLDQFEEFFIRFRTRAAERANFVRELSAVINDPDLDLRVVFSLREEYLAALDGFLEMLPDLFVHAYRLGPLSAFGCREAIVRPLIRDGYEYDEQLVTRLVDELAKFDFDSARLQVTCAELFEASIDAHEHDRKLTEADFVHLTEQLQVPVAVSEVAGSPATLLPGAGAEQPAILEGIFRRYLTRKIAPIAEKWPLVARLVLRVMITREATKYAITLEELRSYQFCTDEDLDQVLAELVERKIVRPPDNSGAPSRRHKRPQWYELIHECLVPEILRWLELDEEFKAFVLVEQLVKTNAEFYDKGSFALLDAKSLARVRAQRARLRLTHGQLRYLLRSAVQCGEFEDVMTWGEAVGWPEARDFVSSLLTPASATVGAAHAAGLFAEAPGDLVEKCYQLATDREQHEDIRGAAARSFARIAPDVVLRELPSSLRLLRVKPHQRDLVAEVYDSGRAGKLWGWIWRRRARKISEERKLLAYTREVGDPSASAVFGVAAGLAWSLTAGVLLALFMYLILPDRMQSEVIALISGATIIGVISGPIVGWRICAAAVAVAATKGEGNWFRTVQRSNLTLLVLWAALAFIAFVTFDAVTKWDDETDLAVSVCVALPLAWLMRTGLAATAQFTMPLIWPDRSWVRVLSLATACALVLWVLVPGIVLLPVLDWIASDASSQANPALLVFLFVQALMSLLTLVLASVLARRPHREFERSSCPDKTWRTITLCTASFGAAIFLAWYLIPRTVEIALTPEPVPVPDPFRHWPERAYIRTTGKHAPTLISLGQAPRENYFFNIGVGEMRDHPAVFRMNEDLYLLSPSETVTFPITNFSALRIGIDRPPFGISRSAGLIETREAPFSGCDLKQLAEGHALQICPLQRAEDGWRATLTGRVPYPGDSRARSYRLVFPSFSRSRTVDAKVLMTGLEKPLEITEGGLTSDGLFVTPTRSESPSYRDRQPGVALWTRRDGNDLVWQVNIKINPDQRLERTLPSQRYVVVGVQGDISFPAYDQQSQRLESLGSKR